jgi:hypothetical protein
MESNPSNLEGTISDEKARSITEFKGIFKDPSSRGVPFADIDNMDSDNKSLSSSLQLTKNVNDKTIKKTLTFLKIVLVVFIKYLFFIR